MDEMVVSIAPINGYDEAFIILEAALVVDACEAPWNRSAAEIASRRLPEGRVQRGNADACSRCRKAACCREQPSGFACCSGHKPGAFDASKLADYSGCKHPQSTALRAFRAAFDSKPAATTTCTNPVLCPSSTVNGPKIRPPTHQVWCLTVLCLLSTSSQTSPSRSRRW